MNNFIKVIFFGVVFTHVFGDSTLIPLESNHSVPTVVFQSGFGDDQTVWNGVHELLKEKLPLYLYDRPGMGDNPAVEGKRDPCTISKELHDRLIASGIKPPYLLVGHSLGGLYQYVFSKMYPDDVSGIVLIDPTHPKNWEIVEQAHPGIAMMIKGMESVGIGGSSRKREFNEQTQCLDQISMEIPLKIPSQLLFSGRADPIANEEYIKEWGKLNQDWIVKLGNAPSDIIWDSGHYIQREDPREVASVVLRVASLPRLDMSELQPIDFDGHHPLPIILSKTKKDDVQKLLGNPVETVAKHSGGEVLIYTDKPFEIPMALSFIPILDVAIEVVEAIQMTQTYHELILQTDINGAIVKYKLRELK